MRVIRTADFPDFKEIKSFLQRPRVDQVTVSSQMLERTEAIFGAPLSCKEAVQKILDDIEQDGDKALISYIDKIDRARMNASELFVSDKEFAQAESQVSSEFRSSLERAISNVRKFHEKQLENSWFVTEKDGSILGQRVVPLDRVGVYVPGGNAPLVSTVVMSSIPARVAGVNQIVMATPVKNRKIDPHLLVAAKACGVDCVLKAGGAQAIGAMAFGTESVPKVDKIVGPGNIFVTLAKKMVFGVVDIESMAGPSEVLVVADQLAPVNYVAADLLSQAEHDPEAACCLVTTSESLAKNIQSELERQLASLPQASIATQSLHRWGLVVLVSSIEEAIELVNEFAPEHLELMVEEPWALLSKIRHAGAIFLGPYSSEPVGDYVAGPNHILPTNGTARFSSPLTTNEFVKKSSVIFYTKEAMIEQGQHAVRLAQVEGLHAHANAVTQRLDDLKGR